MDEPSYLKPVPPSKKEVGQVEHHSDPLVRFKGLVLNLTQSALDCLNRVSQAEIDNIK
jgi:hypothetical protein